MTYAPTTKPDYSRQSGEIMTRVERTKWIDHCRAESRSEGCTFGRISWCELFDPPLMLVEAWKEEPDRYPEPFFHLTYAE